MIERIKPVITTYTGDEYNFIRRRLVRRTIKTADCGICGNRIIPYKDTNWCRYCGNNIDWGIYKKSIKLFRYSLKGFKNVNKRGENNG